MKQEGQRPARCRHLDRAISPVQAARFVLGVRDGETIAGAAAAAGVAVQTLYYRRRIDDGFAAVWNEARAGASADTAAGRALARAERDAAAGTVVRRHGKRLIRKRRRPVEFDRDRKQAFLDHFSVSCNFEESAAEAGVSLTTAYRALKSDSAFRDGFEEALQLGYLCLEAEALREQRAAQEEYRLNPGHPAAKAKSFERTMQLLREYKRAAGGTIGRRADRSRARWTFEATIEAIETKLKAFGVEIPEAPTPQPPPGNPGGEE